MAESNELIAAALTIAIALAVGLTSASFGRDSSATGSSCGAGRGQTAVEKMMRDLVADGEGIANALPKDSVEM